MVDRLAIGFVGDFRHSGKHLSYFVAANVLVRVQSQDWIFRLFVPTFRQCKNPEASYVNNLDLPYCEENLSMVLAGKAHYMVVHDASLQHILNIMNIKG